MQTIPKIKVRVVAYKDRLVIVPKDPEKDITNKRPRLWWPTGGTNRNILGCVLGNSQTMLGVSEEAIQVMRKVQCGHDAIGDLDWWKCDDGTYAFSWWGPIHRIVKPPAMAARGFKVQEGQYIKIVNQVPTAAKKVIDAFKPGEKETAAWKEPYFLEYNSNVPHEE
jgi:hypothetical protein